MFFVFKKNFIYIYIYIYACMYGDWDKQEEYLVIKAIVTPPAKAIKTIDIPESNRILASLQNIQIRSSTNKFLFLRMNFICINCGICTCLPARPRARSSHKKDDNCFGFLVLVDMYSLCHPTHNCNKILKK